MDHRSIRSKPYAHVALIAALILFYLSLTNCRTANSRYRLDLFMEQKYGRKPAEIDGSRFIVASNFAVYADQVELKKSVDNTLILTTSTHWWQEKSERNMLSFDEITRYDVYFKITEPVQAMTIPLAGNSVAQKTGNYDVAPEKKLFYPVAGSLVIDSVAGSHIFSTLNAVYRNIENDTLKLDGRFKAKFR